METLEKQVFFVWPDGIYEGYVPDYDPNRELEDDRTSFCEKYAVQQCGFHQRNEYRNFCKDGLLKISIDPVISVWVEIERVFETKTEAQDAYRKRYKTECTDFH